MGTYTITNAQNVDALVNRTGTRSAIPWTRSGTTATVTWNNHNLASSTSIQVTVSSDTGAIPLGAKTITVTGANTFTFSATNTGATSGTITFTAADAYSINGGTLTIDQDYGIGSAAELDAVIGSITMSASLGGTVDIDGTNVRHIPYNTGSGNVPATGTVISQGGVSGKMIGVWSAINAVPTQPGAAMPAVGIIKIKQKTGGNFAAGALTGITATATGADVPSWITITGLESATATVNRLNTFRIRGDWYSLGTTTGANTGTYQAPTSGKAVYLPGVWVETGTDTNIYEFYPNTLGINATNTLMATEANRGKVCWINSSGVVRFQNDGTNSTGGYLPPSGRRIRIPSVILQNATAAAQATVALPNATLGTRYDFTTTGGGVLEIDHASCAWYLVASQAFSVSINDTCTFSQISLNEIASPLTWNNVGVGHEAANSQTALLMTLCFAGGTISNMIAARSALGAATTYVASITDCIGFTFDTCTFRGNTARGNASADGVGLTRCFDMDFDTVTLIGGGFFLTTCARINFIDTIYYDVTISTTSSTNPTYVWDLNAVTTDILMDGLTFGGLEMLAPYSGILNIAAAGCARIKLRNLGTAAAPLMCGAAERFGQSWSRTTTTATVTTTSAHGLKTGDTIYVSQVSDATPIPLGTKSITVTSGTTFTFTATNSGGTSGTLSYWPANTLSTLVIANGAAANDVRVQRTYIRGYRGAIASMDNSSKNVLLESCWHSPPQLSAVNLAVLNGKFKGLVAAYGTTAQTAVYGTHFIHWCNAEITPDLTALSWSRVTTTATVTSVDHNLRTGDLINVTASSDTAAVQLGPRSVTVLTKDTFTITATNGGAASGTIDIEQHNGRIGLFFNESTAETSTVYTIDSGTPAFTSAGGLYMPTIGQQVTFETPDFIIGHGKFGINDVSVPGASPADYDIYYDLNQGAGFSGSYKNLSYNRTASSGTIGTPTIVLSDATGVAIGDYVTGAGVAPNAKVTNIVSNTLTVDRNNTGAVSGTLRFNHLPSETVTDPAVGFKLRIRVVTRLTNVLTLTTLQFPTYVTAANRALTYPLDTIAYTVNGLVAGSEVRAYVGTNPDTSVEIGGTESSGTSFTFNHSYGGSTGYIIVHKEDYEAVYIPVTYASVDESLLVQQRFDRNYGNP